MTNMAKMEISTNVACKVQCDFCPQELHIKEYSTKNKLNNISYGQPTQMSFDTFKKCLSKIPKSVPIVFSGYTEPFLNPNCSKMIVHAHEKGHTVQVDSTLVGMKEEDVKLIENIPFRVFFLHFADSSNHAKIAVNTHYLRILEKLLSSNIQNFQGMTMAKLHPKIEELLEKNEYSDKMISRCGTVENVQPIPKKTGHSLVTKQQNMILQIELMIMFFFQTVMLHYVVWILVYRILLEIFEKWIMNHFLLLKVIRKCIEN